MARKVGRRSKLTLTLQRQLCKLLAQCVTVKDACAVVGIGETTYYRWLDQGEAAETRLASLAGDEPQPTDEERPYWEFRGAVMRAEAKAKATAAQTVFKGMHVTTARDIAIETFTETRVGKDGKPYEYTRTTTREVLREIPGDWRAAAEYLKRRDRAQWGENIDVTSAGKPVPIVVVKMDVDEL